MHLGQKTTFALLLGALLTGGALLARRLESQGTELRELDPAASAVDRLLYARPFVLDEAYTHWFRAEQPAVRSGWILVLQVDPQVAEPREGLNKVLYVGHQTAERINHGSESGRIVVLVPATLGADGAPLPDWTKEPVFFGGLALPEQVDAARIEAELVAARARGLAPRQATEVAAARQSAGTLLHLPDRLALERELATLILAWSPDAVDADIARGLQVPAVQPR